MTRKRGGAKKKGEGKKGKKTKKRRNDSRRRMSRTEAGRGIMRQVAEQVVDDAQSSAHGVTAPTPQIAAQLRADAAQRRAIAMNRFDRAERGRGDSVDDSSNVLGPFPDLSSQYSNVSMDQSSQGSPGGRKAMDISPEQMSRKPSPHIKRKQGTELDYFGNNGLSMSVKYDPSTGNIPGWFSKHINRIYDVPLFGYSSFSHRYHSGFDTITYQHLMNNLDKLINLYQKYVKGSSGGASAAVPGVMRFMEVYIHAHNGNNPNGCKVCGKQDNQQGIRIELTIPSQGDSSNSYLRSIGFDLLPSDFFNNQEATGMMKDVARVIPYYIIDLINKNNMGQIIREILYSPNQNSVMEEGDNVVCIPLDYYKGRSAGTDPNTRPFGFHKDTIDNKTIYVNLSFDNQVDMYSASLIQCHTDDVDNESQRCKRAIRFKLPPLGTIGFSDFLLAHTTPTGLCGTYSDGSLGANIVCGALARDTTIPQTAQSRIVRGSVGVNIQNVQGILPGAHSRGDGSRREWTVEFDTNVRGRLKRGDGSQIMTNRPNFIRSWFTYFLANDSSNSSSDGKAKLSSEAASDKYQKAIHYHNNSIFSSPITVDLFHHPNSHDGQHTESLHRWNDYTWWGSGGSPDLNHPDNPASFFKIMEVNPDIHYLVKETVKTAFEQVIQLDDALADHLKIITGGKRKKRKGKKTKKRRFQKKRKRKRSRKRKKRKSKKKHT